MRLRLLLSSSLALMLLACSAPPSSTPSDRTTAAPQSQDQPAPPSAVQQDDGVDPSQPAPALSPPDLPTEPVEEEAPIIGVIANPASGPDAAGVDYSCRTDADCTIKNVGNCCGYYPACVNVDSPTFPEQVQAECAASGLSSICGFPSLTGCQCVDNRCEGVTGITATDISSK